MGEGARSAPSPPPRIWSALLDGVTDIFPIPEALAEVDLTLVGVTPARQPPSPALRNARLGLSRLRARVWQHLVVHPMRAFVQPGCTARTHDYLGKGVPCES